MFEHINILLKQNIKPYRLIKILDSSVQSQTRVNGPTEPRRKPQAARRQLSVTYYFKFILPRFSRWKTLVIKMMKVCGRTAGGFAGVNISFSEHILATVRNIVMVFGKVVDQ